MGDVVELYPKVEEPPKRACWVGEEEQMISRANRVTAPCRGQSSAEVGLLGK
jgi:hypothetical protein